MNQIETVFRGRVITVNVEQVLLPTGETARYEIVHHPGGAAIVAITGRGGFSSIAFPCKLRSMANEAEAHG